MKTQTEIEDRIRFLLAEELDRRVVEARERLPRLCCHNHQQPLDSRRQVEGEPNETFNRITDKRGLPVVQTMGLCMLGASSPENWQGTICEDPIDAQRCPDFTAKSQPEAVNVVFRALMQDSTWVRANLPEIAALLWMLDTTEMPKLSEPAPEPEPEPEPEPYVPTPLPWWKRFLLRWLVGFRDPTLPSHKVE